MLTEGGVIPVTLLKTLTTSSDVTGNCGKAMTVSRSTASDGNSRGVKPN